MNCNNILHLYREIYSLLHVHSISYFITTVIEIWSALLCRWETNPKKFKDLSNVKHLKLSVRFLTPKPNVAATQLVDEVLCWWWWWWWGRAAAGLMLADLGFHRCYKSQGQTERWQRAAASAKVLTATWFHLRHLIWPPTILQCGQSTDYLNSYLHWYLWYL